MHTSSRLVSAFALLLGACQGPAGPAGLAGANGQDGQNGTNGQNGNPGGKGDPGTSPPTTGTLAGTVTDATLKDPLAGVAITVSDSGGVELATATTDAAGRYTVTAPLGGVVVAFTKTYWTSPGGLLVGVIGGKTVTVDAALAEAASGRPSVSLSVSGDDVGYGAAATVTAAAQSPTGSALTYGWSNATVPAIGTVDGNGAAATITLPTWAAATATRLEDPNQPNQYITGYPLESRFGILPIVNDARGTVTAQLVVSDGRGQSTTASVSVNAASIQTGNSNVALGTRVYMNSGHDSGNAWSLTAPQGSAATLDDATARTPSFFADVKGAYVLKEGANTATLSAGDWVGAITGGTGDSITVDRNCTICHNGSIAPDKFTPWQATKHSTMFTRGINGENGAYYSGACIACHTVGNDPGAANHGFDDMASTVGWSMPLSLGPTAWSDLVAAQPAVARLANVQCESCHGPNDSDAHMNGGNFVITPWTSLYQNRRIDFGAEVCGTCHAAGTGHHLYSEWRTADPATGWSHSNRGSVALGASASGLSSSCGRCHTAQGYVQYTAQLQAGNPGSLTVTVGATSANAEPVTCVACHDPHDATNPNQLRWSGDTPMLPAGFRMYGVGKGAVCITCHNSRNATYVVNGVTNTYLHEDGEPYNSGNPTAYSAPHQACQGDVFAGRNAYFLGAQTPMTSKHAAIADACVGCHMARNPESHTAHGTATVSSHVFRISDDGRAALCGGCHGQGVDGEALQASIEANLTQLSAKMGAAVISRIAALPNGRATLVVWDSTTDLYSIAPGAAKNPNGLAPLVLDVTQNPIVSGSAEEIHGQIGFVLTLTSPIAVQFVDASGAPSGNPKSLTQLAVQMGSIKDTQTTPAVVFPLSSNLVRAGWNYFLIEGDQSRGLHNPTFAATVLNTTISKDLTK